MALAKGGTKQTKIIRTAKFYLVEKNLYDKVFCRFDIITGEIENSEFENPNNNKSKLS